MAASNNEVHGKAPKESTVAAPFQPQAVRFASVNEEFGPVQSTPSLTTTLSSEKSPSDGEFGSEARDEIPTLSKGLQGLELQHRRMSNFGFEPVSLPASRVPSTESSQNNVSWQATESHDSLSNMPPPAFPIPNSLAPASSPVRETLLNPTDASGGQLAKVEPGPFRAAPNISSLGSASPPVSAERSNNRSAISSAATSRPSSASDLLSTQPTSLSEHVGGGGSAPKRPSIYSLGRRGDSTPRSDLSVSAATSSSGAVTPPLAYEGPFAPAGERDDPYARSKRPPQNKNLGSIDQRFVFEAKDSHRRPGFMPGSGSGVSSSSLPRSRSGNDLKAQNDHKSTFSLPSLAGKKDHLSHLQENQPSTHGGKSHGSMTELKRFFGIGSKSKRSRSPSTATKSQQSSGIRTPPHQLPPTNVPFADDHGLQTKYGKFGKVLGSGAGGSVRLMKRSSDGVTFAVKQFRDRHSYESEREYAKKVTAEFCVGSTLHHGNIIETLDIVHEGGRWYEVMEYAPYDLFAIVMTGKMSREEISCTFLQIISGVQFLHSMGLAHRDLKLDNVVVNQHGIMKIIDFGSASVFRYPFESDIVLATGIVGSDPYLAPEVYEMTKYDPQPADIWSLAIIFACMTLRRFPWKAPRITDNSYKLFISSPTTTETEVKRSSESRTKPSIENTPIIDDSRQTSVPPHESVHHKKPEEALGEQHIHHHGHHSHHNHHKSKGPENSSTNEVEPSRASASSSTETPAAKQEVIKGPWRLLRILPRESRSIIGSMLEIQPSDRATLKDLLNDPWIAKSPVCSQLESGQVLNAPGHQHTLEASTTGTPAPSHK